MAEWAGPDRPRDRSVLHAPHRARPRQPPPTARLEGRRRRRARPPARLAARPERRSLPALRPHLGLRAVLPGVASDRWRPPRSDRDHLSPGPVSYQSLRAGPLSPGPPLRRQPERAHPLGRPGPGLRAGRMGGLRLALGRARGPMARPGAGEGPRGGRRPARPLRRSLGGLGQRLRLPSRGVRRPVRRPGRPQLLAPQEAGLAVGRARPLVRDRGVDRPDRPRGHLAPGPSRPALEGPRGPRRRAGVGRRPECPRLRRRKPAQLAVRLSHQSRALGQPGAGVGGQRLAVVGAHRGAAAPPHRRALPAGPAHRAVALRGGVRRTRRGQLDRAADRSRPARPGRPQLQPLRAEPPILVPDASPAGAPAGRFGGRAVPVGQAPARLAHDRRRAGRRRAGRGGRLGGAVDPPRRAATSPRSMHRRPRS